MDKALKQRLVGASVLIVLAVIVLPMLLSGRSDTLKQESRQIEMPPKPEELSIETRRFPVGLPNKPANSVQDPQTRSETESTHENAPDISPETITPLPDKQEISAGNNEASELVADVDTESETETVEKPQVKPPAVTSITLKSGRDKGLDVEKPAPGTGSVDTPRYLVQVASFSSEKNANLLAGKLRDQNLPVMMDVVDRVAGLLHRVRVGPYEERAEADAIVASLRSKMNDLAPRVLDLRPDDNAPVSTPSDPLVRWVVQVGSFGTADAADTLVARLRLAGLTAFSEKVTTGADTAYKVRVGPELNRDKAVALAKQLETKHQLKGFVTTQE